MTDFKDMSLAALFRAEAEGHLPALTQGLLALERGDAGAVPAMMRSAHSLKGAARIVGLETVVRLAHALEDAFVGAQRGELALDRRQIDRLLAAVDLLGRITRAPEQEMARVSAEAAEEVDGLAATITSWRHAPRETPPPPAEREPAPVDSPAVRNEAIVRASAEGMNRLLGLAGEAMLEARRWHALGTGLARLKRLQHDTAVRLEGLRTVLPADPASAPLREALAEAQQQLAAARALLGEQLLAHDALDRGAADVSRRLYDEVMAIRMRPFADGTLGFARLVRDVAGRLGKQVQLELRGLDTQVDRDVLARIEAPLVHLLRNAVDHGIEAPGVRLAAGKPAAGTVTVEARHNAGVLLITVADDGRGIAPEVLRRAVVERGLVAADTAATLTEPELLEFLFLPGFTLAPAVTEISGRGVGLDVVQTAVREVRGTVRAVSQPGAGTRFELKLPVSLSVVRALLVQVSGEVYAVPLGFVRRTVRLAPDAVAQTEGRPHFEFEGRRLGLVAAAQVLGTPPSAQTADICAVVLGEGERSFGIVVDRFLGESELMVQPLDPRLGKVKDIAAAAVTQDGAPVLILDVADFVRSTEKIAASGEVGAVRTAAVRAATGARKRVLVVDDSLTVRELERKLLAARGYTVEIAVDGMDGWNVLRSGKFDLVVADVDMPRLDGIELTRLIKQDARSRGIPVIIVSYKDRPEDKERGLQAGADYYLTKASFNDATFVDAVADLVGVAEVSS